MKKRIRTTTKTRIHIIQQLLQPDSLISVKGRVVLKLVLVNNTFMFSFSCSTNYFIVCCNQTIKWLHCQQFQDLRIADDNLIYAISNYTATTGRHIVLVVLFNFSYKNFLSAVQRVQHLYLFNVHFHFIILFLNIVHFWCLFFCVKIVKKSVAFSFVFFCT